MSFRPRLTTFLAQFLAPLPLAACDLIPLPVQPLDDVACLYEDVGGTCPDDVTAADALLGTQTCTSPVREVTRVGTLVSEQEVTLEPYGFTYPTGDTGLAEVRLECCYEAAYRTRSNQSCVIGRPAMVDGEMVSAQAASREDWAGETAPRLSGLTRSARAALAAAWTQTGLLEHASVPAFARVVLELTALGAPADLVARASQAMSDEIRHAQACFALASAYAGRPVGPGPLELPATRAPSLVELAVETFREACVGETVAVGIAAAQRAHATDPAVRAVLDQIIEDETDHAALGWDIVRWALATGGPEVRVALEHEVASISAPTHDPTLPPEGAASHGMAEPRLVERVLQGILDTVVRPEAEGLLTRPTRS